MLSSLGQSNLSGPGNPVRLARRGSPRRHAGGVRGGFPSGNLTFPGADALPCDACCRASERPSAASNHHDGRSFCSARRRPRRAAARLDRDATLRPSLHEPSASGDFFPPACLTFKAWLLIDGLDLVPRQSVPTRRRRGPGRGDAKARGEKPIAVAISVAEMTVFCVFGKGHLFRNTEPAVPDD